MRKRCDGDLNGPVIVQFIKVRLIKVMKVLAVTNYVSEIAERKY